MMNDDKVLCDKARCRPWLCSLVIAETGRAIETEIMRNGLVADGMQRSSRKKDLAMLRSLFTIFIRACFLPVILSGPIWSQTPAAHPPRPGSVNYVEGQASIGTMPLMATAIGTIEVDRGQTATTEAGKLEILLTPGVFLRLADNSSLKMISPDLANTKVQLEKGRAMIEVIDIQKGNDIRVGVNDAEVKLLKKGLYDFDADHKEVRVFTGSAQITAGNRKVTLGGGKKVTLGGADLKAVNFETRQYEDEFYRWCGLRSGYLSEASVDVGRSYIGPGPGWYGPGWYGLGWYWDPWLDVYTFLPVDGIYYGPFGWGFYSPIAVYRSPFYFYGHYPHPFGDFHYPYGHGFPRPGGPGMEGRPRR